MPLKTLFQVFSKPYAPEAEEIPCMEQRPVQSAEVHLKKKKKKKNAPLVSSSEAAEVEENHIYHLSDKPFFDIVLVRSHVMPPYILCLPVNVIDMLPRATIPVVLRHKGKNWNMSYAGDSSRPRFGPKWRTFVTENNLKVGDACVFELMEPTNTNLKLRVLILRGDTPPELLALVDTRGKTSVTPIVVD
ncbi:hypothetical protein BUALT_Bualt19G0032400 [Buddleja alternifolia]|uniref:TF-B3 domain-containing protein n=1 Tax=Buddleja alternifolia TaxID=168488 RepID=A0AAV6W207_9LAMI|nr:hypothetical protein BUALT_Bualt19G0032400 [Buddleja alternifolia]